MAQSPKSITSILTYLSLGFGLLAPLIVADLCGWPGMNKKAKGCINTQFGYGTMWTFISFHTVLVINIFTKVDMHKLAKEIILGIGAGCHFFVFLDIIVGDATKNDVVFTKPTYHSYDYPPGNIDPDAINKALKAAEKPEDPSPRYITTGVFCFVVCALQIAHLVLIILKK